MRFHSFERRSVRETADGRAWYHWHISCLSASVHIVVVLYPVRLCRKKNADIIRHSQETRVIDDGMRGWAKIIGTRLSIASTCTRTQPRNAQPIRKQCHRGENASVHLFGTAEQKSALKNKKPPKKNEISGECCCVRMISRAAYAP